MNQPLNDAIHDHDMKDSCLTVTYDHGNCTNLYMKYLPTNIDDAYHLLDDVYDNFSFRREKLEKEESTNISKLLLATYKSSSSLLATPTSTPGDFSVSKESNKDDVKSLLNEIRPSSKWYDPKKIGQDILYDALERTLNELKGITEHSIPFQNKVSKRDAPDYYDIILEPMDLGTMMKKLKSYQYFSKESFSYDLRLIWNNCLLYNTDPKSIYRYHAQVMEKRANQLLDTVPDLTIIEKPDDAELDHVYSSSSMNSVVTGVGDDGDNKIGAAHDDQSEKARHAAEIVYDNMWRRGKGILPGVLSNDGKEQFLVKKETPSVFVEWNAYLCDWMSRSFLKSIHNEEKPFGEREAIIRTTQGMGMFISHSVHDKKEKNAFCYSNAKIVTSEDPFLPELFYVGSSVPDSLKESGVPLSPSNFSDVNVKVPCLFVKETIKKLRNLRWLSQKIDAHQNNQEVYEMAFTDTAFEEDDDDQDVLVTEDDCSKNDQAISSTLTPLFTQQLNLHFLQSVVACQYMYVGFETVERMGLVILTELLDEYLSKFCMMLKSYLEEYSNEMTMSQLLCHHVLKEMGVVSGYHGLETFWREHVVLYRQKINDLQRKLEKRLNDLLEEEAMERTDGIGNEKKDAGEDEVDFEDNDPAFLTGCFGEDVGLDYFGLKDIGLDNVRIPPSLISNAPTKLTMKKVFSTKLEPSGIPNTPTTVTHLYQPRSPWSAIDADHQIGLMRNFLAERKASLLEQPLSTSTKNTGLHQEASTVQLSSPVVHMQLDDANYDGDDWDNS